MLNRSWATRSESAAVVAVGIPCDEERAPSPLSRLLAASLISLIDAYRRIVSPLLGPHCRFHPTCSQYAVEAIRKYGPVHGSARAVLRLARCQPLCEGGFDPVR